MSPRAAVITCSDTAAADPGQNTSGPLAARLLEDLAFEVAERTVVPDDVDRIQAAVGAAIRAGCRVVACTGGTGLGPRDVTPEAMTGLGARPIPGIGEAIRAGSRDRVPTTDLSRAGAVVIDGAVVLMLPGSPGGVRDGLAVAGPVLPHALAMIDGAGHGPRGAPPPGDPTGPAGGAPPGTGSPRGETPAAGQAANLVGPDVIDLEALVREVAQDAAGAVVSFEGRVRDRDHGRTVTSLTYEAHPDAGAVLADVVAQARTRPGVLAATAVHRTGSLAIGDLAFAVAVAAAHRRDAFDASAWLVDEAKARTPIWKHQSFSDGTSEWVNCP